MTLFGGQRAEDEHALLDNCGRDGLFGVEGPCLRARPGRERKQVQIAERQRADESYGLFEFGVGLSGKADYDVGTQGQVRSGGAHKSLNLIRVVPWAVAAMHATEDG